MEMVRADWMSRHVAAGGELCLFHCFHRVRRDEVLRCLSDRTHYGKGDPRVANALGSPIEAGFFVSGKTNVSGSSGNADLTIPIWGPRGKGTIYFVASKFAGKWTFSRLVVEVGKTGEMIDLIEKVPKTVP